MTKNHCAGIPQKLTNDPIKQSRCFEEAPQHNVEESGVKFQISHTNGTILKVDVDKCLYANEGAFEKCDFAFMDCTNGHWHFVELKKAAGKNNEQDIEKAADQLVSTIEQFRQKGVATDSQKMTCYVATLNTIAQTNQRKFEAFKRNIQTKGKSIKVVWWTRNVELR